ncbi:hypothetical protein HK099_002266, partial [Clydaea vesicula]
EDEGNLASHIKRMRKNGVFGGNMEVCAFAREYNVDIVLHQVNSPVWVVRGDESNDNLKKIHLIYHSWEHYSSVRNKDGTLNVLQPKPDELEGEEKIVNQSLEISECYNEDPILNFELESNEIELHEDCLLGIAKKDSLREEELLLSTRNINIDTDDSELEKKKMPLEEEEVLLEANGNLPEQNLKAKIVKEECKFEILPSNQNVEKITNNVNEIKVKKKTKREKKIEQKVRSKQNRLNKLNKDFHVNSEATLNNQNVFEKSVVYI